MLADPNDPLQKDSVVVQQLIDSLVTIGRTTRRTMTRTLDDSSYWLLRVLSCTDGMRLTDLAAESGLDSSTVSRHVGRLEKSGSVERTPDPDDGRATRLTVSTAGQELLSTARAERREILASRLGSWPSADVLTLAKLLGRLADEVSAAAPPTIPSPEGDIRD